VDTATQTDNLSQPKFDCDTQQCSGECGKELPLTEENYHRDIHATLGFRKICKACRRKENDRASDEKLEELLQGLQDQGLDIIGKLGSSRGSATPHVTELYQYLMRAFGGTEVFSRLLVAEYFKANPGSMIRSKYLESIMRLGTKCSEQGFLDRDLENTSTEDIQRVLDERVKQLYPEFHPNANRDTSENRPVGISEAF
jgi:hypothetical protein